MTAQPTPWTGLVLLGAWCAAAGCAARGDVEILEARLRNGQDEIARLRSEVNLARSEAAIARRDADQLRGQLASRGEAVVLPEQADALYRASDLTINGLVTAGLDTDGRPGDDALVTTITPVDDTGSPVKLPGRLEVVLAERGTEDTPGRPLHRWVLPPEQARKQWQADLLAGGFRLQLPLGDTAVPQEVTLLATLDTADGRTFEASHDLELRTGGSHAHPRSHAERGNAEPDAPRRRAGGSVADAERQGARSHAERGNEVGIGPRFAPVDGRRDANGNGGGRASPVRTSDVFEANAPRRYQ